MSLKRRLNRIERQFTTANIGQRVNNLVLDLYFPPVDEDTDYMSKAWAIDWLQKRNEIAKVEQHLNICLFEQAVLLVDDWSNGGFLKHVAPEYPTWPEHLKRYKEETDCIIAAHLMDKFNLKPNYA